MATLKYVIERIPQGSSRELCNIVIVIVLLFFSACSPADKYRAQNMGHLGVAYTKLSQIDNDAISIEQVVKYAQEEMHVKLINPPGETNIAKCYILHPATGEGGVLIEENALVFSEPRLRFYEGGSYFSIYETK